MDNPSVYNHIVDKIAEKTIKDLQEKVKQLEEKNKKLDDWGIEISNILKGGYYLLEYEDKKYTGRFANVCDVVFGYLKHYGNLEEFNKKVKITTIKKETAEVLYGETK